MTTAAGNREYFHRVLLRANRAYAQSVRRFMVLDDIPPLFCPIS